MSTFNFHVLTFNSFVLWWQYNVSDPWFPWENDVIGFAELEDVGLVSYSNISGDISKVNATILSTANQSSPFPPQLGDVVFFNDTSERRFAVAVRVDQSMFSVQFLMPKTGTARHS